MKTLAFLVVVGLISLLSITGYSLYLNPPVREVIVEKIVYVEKPKPPDCRHCDDED